MEPAQDTRNRKREFIVIRHKQQYYYAKLDATHSDQYNVMAACTEFEARGIVEAANRGSSFNGEVGS